MGSLHALSRSSALVRLKEVTVIRAPIARCFDLARSVEAHLAGNVHWGEAVVAEGGSTSGLVDLGQRVLRRSMQRLLRERIAVLKQIAESEEWQRLLPL